MMECKVIRAKLSAFLEGAVSPEERRLIGEHLPACHACSDALEDLKKTEVLLRGLEEVEPPAWFKQKVMARIRAEQEAKKSILQKLFYPLHVKIPIEAFATVLIAVVAIYIFKAVQPEMKRIPSVSPGRVALAPEDKSEKRVTAKKGTIIANADENRPLLAQKRDEALKQPSGPFSLAPKENAVREKDVYSGDKGELALSEEEREKEITEGKKSAVVEVKEGESKAEENKPVPDEPPSKSMLAKREKPVDGMLGKEVDVLEQQAQPRASYKARIGRSYMPSSEPKSKISSLKDYNAVVVQDLEVPSGSPSPESAGMQMAAKAVFQIKRYNEKYRLFDIVAKEGGKASQEMPPGGKVLIIKGEVREYSPPTVGRRIGRSFMPGGEWTGTATFAAHYTFIDKESGKVIYETDLRTSSTGTNDTVEFAMDRNGEALAKTITKLKGE
jgi:hypothetical protein